MGRVEIEIITCPQWGARKPKHLLELCKMSHRVIFHHTAGHHREISVPGDESVEEAKRYARDIQRYHMDVNGWTDSGHNFLVCRNGLILQGRWLTVSAIRADHMVVSAHCPGQNTQIGIEHEHKGSEEMTSAQRHSSARLQAWIAWQYNLHAPLPASPHSAFYSTSCPANLESDIQHIRGMAMKILGDG